MSKLVKIIISALGGVIILIAVGVWYAASTVDPVQLTKLLSSSVKTATGRDLKITGPVSLSFFPGISVSAEGLSLSNASWGSDSEMLTLKRIDLNIKTLPLLSKRIEIGSVKLTGLEVFLQKNGAGKANWDFSAEASGGSPAANNNSVSSPASDNLISMDSVSIADARIQYQNPSNAISSYQIGRLSLTDSGDKTVVSLSMKVQDQALELSGKTGSLSRLLKQWNVSSAQFPVDLNLTMNGKSMMMKGELSKNPKTPPMINLSLNSKAFDWPVLGVSPNHPPRAVSGDKSVLVVHQVQKPQPKYLFSNESIPFDLLPQAKGEIVINIGELNLPKRKPIENLQASLQLNGSVIDIPNLRFGMGKGSAGLQIKLSELDTSTPVLTAKGVTKDLTLENLLARLDPGSKVSGGSMKMAFDVKTSGSSFHQMASNSSGKIQLSINQARMGTNFLNDAGDFVVTLLDSMNPLRKKTTETVLECAVAYLPINNGQINIAKSVGIETDKLDAALAGYINLKTEAINLTIDPQEKSGLTTGLDLTGMVKMGGTLTNPKAGINQAGVVNSAVSIGLGFLTGGASILAENARSMTSKSHPCRDALHPWSDIYPGAE
ncbi:AsmA family protein [Polynucleobacter sp. AP-Sving-400A-A2]|uniref:AsmA family protein n=1 Tax=Polynucleobacter sp. AP-Sving-400A-A2 TaxID=2081049 RepID=UPI001BFE3137|nr:AsmA family protein [Polynucleobacter sp. AP-Sving-400A-A2]QWE15144.1 AsmA family protein [Polynucleobacter sp. AP-Sving-400A-A2]